MRNLENGCREEAKKSRGKCKKGMAVLLTTITAAGMLAGCGQSSETIHMATKPMTEQYIMGSMMKTLIEQDTDLTVEVTEGVGGGTANIQPAMEKGEFDLYPEYTSSGWILVLGHEAGEVSDDEMFEKLKEEYEENYDMTLSYVLIRRKSMDWRPAPIWQKYLTSSYSAAIPIISSVRTDSRECPRLMDLSLRILWISTSV